MREPRYENKSNGEEVRKQTVQTVGDEMRFRELTASRLVTAEWQCAID